MREYCIGCENSGLTCATCIDGCNRKPAAFKSEKNLVDSLAKAKYVPYNQASFIKEKNMGINWKVENFEVESCSPTSLPSIQASLIGFVDNYGAFKNRSFKEIVQELEHRLNRNLRLNPGPSCYAPQIKNVIFNPPATIVFWTDGSKTVVKAENEAFDPEKGLAMAFMKKSLGNKGNYFNTVKKWTEKYIPEIPVIDAESLYRVWFRVDDEVSFLPYCYRHKSSAKRRAKTWFADESNVEWAVSKTNPWAEEVVNET